MGNSSSQNRRGSDVPLSPDTAAALAARKNRSGSAYRRHVAGLHLDTESSAGGKRRNVMRGTMTKRGRVRKNWKDRFFVLEEGLLSYYESEVLMYKGDDPKGAIMVKQLLPWLAFHGTDDKNGDTGMVVVGEENRALHIIAPTPEVREQWEKALKYAAGMNNMDQEPQTAVVAQDAGCAFWQKITAAGEWLLQPAELESDDRYGFLYGWVVPSCLTVGGLLYEHISRDDLAADCAGRALRFHRKPCAHIEAHLILARVARRRKGLDEANTHFRTASELAVRFDMPFYSLIAGKHCGGELGNELIEVGLRAFEAVDGSLQRARTVDTFPFLKD